jgi:hypothetical protein
MQRPAEKTKLSLRYNTALAIAVAIIRERETKVEIAFIMHGLGM